MKTAVSIVQRILSTFIVNAMAIIGGASIIGGIPVAKSALLAGISAVVTVIERLARASVDGNLTTAEINAAFTGVIPAEKNKESDSQ
jgi:hypothetical protein